MYYITESCYNLLTSHEKHILYKSGIFTYTDFVNAIKSDSLNFRRSVGKELFLLLTRPSRYCVSDSNFNEYRQLSFFDGLDEE